MYARLSPDEALARLRAGNQRFVSGACRVRALASPAARRERLTLLSSDVAPHRDALLRAAVRANVRASTDALQRGSPTLARLAAGRYVSIVGAVYARGTGVVECVSDAAKP